MKELHIYKNNTICLSTIFLILLVIGAFLFELEHKSVKTDKVVDDTKYIYLDPKSDNSHNFTLIWLHGVR